MIVALRKITDEAALKLSANIHNLYESTYRREKYQAERDAKNGTVPLTDKVETVVPSRLQDFDTGLIFWDVLRDCDHETALYMVLRHCLGYAVAEVAAGLGVGYNRVKYMTSKAATHIRERY